MRRNHRLPTVLAILGALAVIWGVISGGAIPRVHAAESFTFPVRTVRLEGVTVFRDGDLSPLVQPVIGQNVSLADLKAVADAITGFYRANGFMFAYAYIPPQEIVDGSVVIAVEEGRYADVILDNQSRLNDLTAIPLLGPVQPGAVIEEQSLTWAMRRLDGAAGVAASSVFRPTGTPGEAELVVTIQDDKRQSGSLSVDNYGSEHMGVTRTTAVAEFENVTGRADRIGLRIVTGSGIFSGRLAYALPSFLWGGQYYWSAAYSTVQYRLGGVFEPLESNGRTDALEISLQGPGRSIGATSSFGEVPRQAHRVNQFGYAFRHHQDRILGVTTPWQTHALTAEQSEEWPLVSLTGVDRYSAGLTLGYLLTPDPDAAEHDAAGVKIAGFYAKLNVSMEWRARLRWGLMLRTTLSGQWASKNLHSSEKFSLSGPPGVRAYESGRGSGDEGILARIELARPFANSQWVGSIFLDGGGVTVNKRPWNAAADKSETLVGAGVAWAFDNGPFQFRIEGAWPISVGAAAEAAAGAPARVWVKATWSF